MGDEKAPGKGTGSHAEAGDESTQDERIADLEARVAALEGGTTAADETASDTPTTY